MTRISTNHGGADALVRPAEQSSAWGSSLPQAIDMSHGTGETGTDTTSETAEKLSSSTTGKGTTLVVPPMASKEAALATGRDAVNHAARPGWRCTA
jgi:hypothetical protein